MNIQLCIELSNVSEVDDSATGGRDQLFFTTLLYFCCRTEFMVTVQYCTVSLLYYLVDKSLGNERQKLYEIKATNDN